ncbi:hypothetical protein D9M71_367820 [compost metagenome]
MGDRVRPGAREVRADADSREADLLAILGGSGTERSLDGRHITQVDAFLGIGNRGIADEPECLVREIAGEGNRFGRVEPVLLGRRQQAHV